MKLTQRYVLCVVAMLLLFSAYCRPVSVPHYRDDLNYQLIDMRWSGLSKRYHPEFKGRMLNLHPGSAASTCIQANSAYLVYPVGFIRPYRLSSTFLSPVKGNTEMAAAITLPRIIVPAAGYGNPKMYQEAKQRSGFGRGAGIGAAVGAGLGALIGLAADGNPGTWSDPSPVESLLFGALAGALLGVLIGGTIGALTKKRKTN